MNFKGETKQTAPKNLFFITRMLANDTARASDCSLVSILPVTDGIVSFLNSCVEVPAPRTLAVTEDKALKKVIRLK